MKLINFKLSLLLMISATFLFSCEMDDDETATEDQVIISTLEGQPGNPRFNLKFTNEQNVDLDLHVIGPDGVEIYWGNPRVYQGDNVIAQLDVDCLCDECPNGPSENIYWENGTAPSGEYKYWVEYYGSCDSGYPPSEFTVYVIRNDRIVSKHTGTLTGSDSDVWSHVQ